jgi:hypothetical protein
MFLEVGPIHMARTIVPREGGPHRWGGNGASLAWWLARSGDRVTLVDQSSPAMPGSPPVAKPGGRGCTEADGCGCRRGADENVVSLAGRERAKTPAGDSLNVQRESPTGGSLPSMDCLKPEVEAAGIEPASAASRISARKRSVVGGSRFAGREGLRRLRPCGPNCSHLASDQRGRGNVESFVPQTSRAWTARGRKSRSACPRARIGQPSWAIRTR